MANIYQAGGKAVGKLLSKGAPSKVYSTGAKGESAIAEKLGAAISEKEAGKVAPEVQAKLGAMEAMKLLQEEGTPTFKTTQADLQSFAKDNPNASPEELAAMYRGSAPAKPTPYRMKEKVEPVSAPREIEEPASQERVYEAYGKAADGETRFADEDGTGLEGLVSRPQDEVVGAGMGGMPADATLADRISGKKPLTKTQKAGAGLAAVGAAGMVKGALTPEDEDKSVPGARLSPKITGETYKDIKFEPSAAEVQAAVDKGGIDTLNALWDKYNTLNTEFQKNVTEGGMEYSDPKKAAAVFLQSKQPFTGPPRGAAGKPAVEEKVSAETEKMTTPAATADMTKEKQAKPAPPPGGVVSKPSPTQVKGTVAAGPSQDEIALSTGIDIDQFKNKLASGKPVTRGDLLAITNKMEELKPNQVTTDKSLIQKIEAAKEEARRAYQQEADRNQWAEVAQTLGNAVATFVAARQGVADRPLTLPQIDYSSRTAQALRAYQTELASVGEQARAVERETERKQLAEDKRVALQQRQYEQLLSLGEKDIEARERKAAQERDLATRIQLSQIKDAQDRQAAAVKASKEEAAARRKGGETLASWLKADINNTENQIKAMEKQLEIANKVAVTKDDKALVKELPAYLTASGLGQDDPQFQETGWFGGVSQDSGAIRDSAKATAARLRGEIANLRAKTKSDNEELRGLLPVILGQGKAAAPQQPARQEPAGGGMVQVELNGQPGTIPADQLEAFKKKYPNAVIKQ